MIKDGLSNGILLTNIWYCIARMEKVLKCYEMAATGDYYTVRIETVS